MAYNSGSGSLFVPKMCKKTMPVLDDQSWELSSGSENASAGLNHERWMRWTHTWHSGPGEEATWQRQQCGVLGWQVDLEAPVTCFREGLLSPVFGQINMSLNF